MNQITKIETCRVCGSKDLTHLFSLGEQFVSSFVPKEEIGKGIKCPISICLCAKCTLVQQEYTAPQDFMYTKHYWYRSGTTETMRKALADIVASIVLSIPPLEKNDIVLDIGANDGELLSNYSDHVIRVAVEPATNMRELCKQHCDIFIPEFWSEKAYAANLMFEGGYKKAKVITAIGMFYDLPDPNQFIADIAKVLHPEGVFIAQLMCLKQTLEQGDVGNFAHEHLQFYSLRSLRTLLGMHKLTIYDIEENNINGGSYRLYIQHWGGPHAITMRYLDFLNQEEVLELAKPSTYITFLQRIEEGKEKVAKFIGEIAANNEVVAVYGASTKGNVILQYYGLDDYDIYMAVDKSPEKVGLYCCNGSLIVSEEIASSCSIYYYLVLPYAFLEEFLKREREFLIYGGKFIVPLPYPRTIEADPEDLKEIKHWVPKDRMPMLKVVAL